MLSTERSARGNQNPRLKPTRFPVDQPRGCTVCGQVKGPANFLVRQGLSGPSLSPVCGQCSTERMREWAIKNPDKVKAQRAHRRAKEDPEIRRRYREEYFQQNKDKIRVRNKEFRDANLEKVRLRYLAAIYKRRAFGCDKRKAEVRAEIAAALELYRVGDMYWDVYESKLISAPSIDHVNPVSLGGVNHRDNLVVTSGKNNSSKNNTPLLLWLIKRANRNNAGRNRECSEVA